MAFAQVDQMAISTSARSSDLTGSHASAEHVVPSAFPPMQDANALREAALRSRRARKQAASTAASQAQATATQSTNAAKDDAQIEDRSVRAVLEEAPRALSIDMDTEDGEICEDGQNKSASDANTSGTEKYEPLQPSPNQTHQETLTGHTNQSVGLVDTTLSGPSLDSTKFVRPSLNMTARDLDEAKRLILDLLGLGVKPEYLVDCGISPQCLAICFYEMGLRFPVNLDRSKVNLPTAYDVDKHMEDSIRKEQLVRQRDRNRAAQKTPNPSIAVSNTSAPPGSKMTLLPDTDRSVSISKQKKGLLPDPPTSLPPKPVVQPPKKGELPHDVEVIIAQRKADTRSPPTGPRAMREGADTTVMEDQKRMELLARKAAMDSVTRKRAARSSPNPGSDDPNQPSMQSRGLEIEDVDSAVDALLAAVRLNSVSSEQLGGQYDDNRLDDFESTVEERLSDYDSDAMVEDELDAHTPTFSELTDGTTPEPTLVLSGTLQLSPQHTPPEVSQPLQPASSVLNNRVRFQSVDPASPSGPSTHHSTVVVPVAARKSRPIASDFIDQAPPLSTTPFAGESGPSAPLKRKRSFIDPQVWPRRLVIDLDSSDEEDEDEVEGGLFNSTTSASVSSSRGSVERNTGNGGNGNPANDTAVQMLLEKELQIKAMMQKIKMRELKKKKAGTPSVSGTPVLVAATVAPVPEGVVALPPVSITVPAPTGSQDIDITAAQVVDQETTPEVNSTLGIQQAKLDTSVSSSTNDASGLGVNSPKVDKGERKSLEPEVIVAGSQDTFMDAPAVVTLDIPAQTAHIQEPIYKEPSSTHFKKYKSPLVGFTSPSLQPANPSDRQLPTIYWISSTAGQVQDTSRQLCQYEFPSGVCKDQNCRDIHTRDLSASDDDLRRIASPMFPNAGPRGLTRIVKRARQSTKL